jgi:hypothetical protein
LAWAGLPVPGYRGSSPARLAFAVDAPILLATSRGADAPAPAVPRAPGLIGDATVANSMSSQCIRDMVAWSSWKDDRDGQTARSFSALARETSRTTARTGGSHKVASRRAARPYSATVARQLASATGWGRAWFRCCGGWASVTRGKGVPAPRGEPHSLQRGAGTHNRPLLDES